MVVSPDTGNLFIAVERSHVFEYDPVAETSTTLYTTPDFAVFISPRLYLNPANSKLYFSDARYQFYEWDAEGQTTTTVPVPIQELYGSDRSHKTDVVFAEDGTPIPYSLGNDDSNVINALAVGGLDGNPATGFPLEELAPNPSPEIAVDVDSQVIYVLGQHLVDGEHDSGIFRMNLDGSGFTKLFDADFRGEMVIDTADLDDDTDPVVSIFSPIGGTTNNQLVSLIGSVSDDSILQGITWSHNGVTQGGVDVFNGDFTVPSIALVPGDNLLEINAVDLAGNSGTAQVSLNWEPLRALTVSNPESVREGQRITASVLLDSPGDVAGMTFKLHYDPAHFESPKVEVGDAIATASPAINSAVPGEVNVTFAKIGEAVASGEHELISVRLRARSVAADDTSGLSVSVQDMADTNGTPIVIGTYAGESAIAIIARNITGDVNSNDRLDTGDSSRMQAMLAGLSEKRAWDDLINDLNGSTTLDSGDVIRVLRAVVGLDEQPPAPVPKGARSTDPDTPQARLALSGNHAAGGEEITVTIELENITEPFSGASFTLEYPAGALRLQDAGDHLPGAVVGGDAFLLWNLAPAQNDYANQSGSIAFGASSSSDWPGSANGGTLASFTFTVAPGASAQALWDLTVRDVELSTDSGFEINPVASGSATFVGQPLSFEAWRAMHFTAAELADPTISGWETNAAAYLAGTAPDMATPMTVEFVRAGDGSGNHCLSVAYARSLTAIDGVAVLQISTDLSTWESVGGDAAETTIDPGGGIETTTVLLPQTSAVRQYVRLLLSLAE